MRINPDQWILWDYGIVHLNGTILFTWMVMGVLVVISWFVTRNLKPTGPIPPVQGAVETVLIFLRNQIQEVGLRPSERYLAFIGTLFLFIAVSNLLSAVPFFEPPTGSLSTTAALALCVFVAVPFYAIREDGLFGFLKGYTEPSPIMLPFHIITELSRTLALAVRLFGNMMSDTLVVAILLVITPIFFPVVLKILGLVIGMVQAYIFSILATVFIAGAVRAKEG